METIYEPDDFYTDTPPPRIIGTECEYSVQGALHVMSFAFSAIRSQMGLKTHDSFNSNGSRVYHDVGHLEYAGPESVGPLDATVSDKAGIEIVRKIGEISGLTYEGIYRQTGSFMEDNYGPLIYQHEQEDDQETNTTRGYHENYQVPRSVVSSPYFARLLPSFLASKLWDGQGTLTENGYVLKQKIWSTGGDVITYSYEHALEAGQKPMIMVREGDDTVRGDWSRVELRCVDGCLSPEAKLVAMGATSLVLRLIEHPKFIEESDLLEFAELQDPIDAAQAYADDLSLTRYARGQYNNEMRAVDVQECFLEAC